MMKAVKNSCFTKGFALIELLVVVLIIGILAAVALPQYQKAVWKSKARLLQQQVMDLVHAQEAYYLEHGEYATDLKTLDLNFPGTYAGTTDAPFSSGSNKNCSALNLANAITYDNILIGISNPTNYVPILSIGCFLDGPYKKSGFRYAHDSGGDYHFKNHTLYCVDPFGGFCQEILGVKADWNPYAGLTMYTLD